MFKLDLEEVQEQEIKLPTFSGSQKNQGHCRKAPTSAFDWVDHNKLWEILKEMGISDHLTCPLRNLYAGKEATAISRHGTMDWFKIGKGVHQAIYCHPAYLNFM